MIEAFGIVHLWVRVRVEVKVRFKVGVKVGVKVIDRFRVIELES
jgi:hypothetical protein